MMSSKIIRKVISTSKAPAAIGPYSQAVQAGNLLFISGQLGFDPKTMTIVPGGVVSETEQVLNNIKSILDEAGCTLKNVVKTTVLLADINDFSSVNEVYSKFFSESCPARAAYQVAALPKGGRVEIETIAILGDITSSL
ncbi:UNVERIFIED_CONTAM: hypothetical protein RMT77_005546 [Armadillidium vulgare]